MTLFQKLHLQILLGILTAAALGAQSPARLPGLSDAGKAALNAQLKDSVARGDTMGVNALVVNRDAVIFQGAAGIPANSIFNIASMTKPVTSVAIMMLTEQGKLKLDDPVSKYLDGYDKLQVISKFNEKDGTYETRPAKRAMTVRHLLSHTSGIGYTTWSAAALKIQETTKKNEWEQPLLNDPGDVWHYSASTRVLGFIVEAVTKTPLENWYHEHIFAPLGMNDTSYAVATAKQPRLAPQYPARRRQARAAAEDADRVDADAAVSRRRWPLLHDGGLRQVRTHADWRR